MLWLIIAILTILWLAGWILEVGGNYIHLVLIVAFVVMVYNFFRGGPAEQ